MKKNINSLNGINITHRSLTNYNGVCKYFFINNRGCIQNYKIKSMIEGEFITYFNEKF